MISIVKLISEIKIFPTGFIPKIGVVYDIKQWWDPPTDYNLTGIKHYVRPVGRTIPGDEGYYWMIGYKYTGIEDDNFIFNDTYFEGVIEIPVNELIKNDMRIHT